MEHRSSALRRGVSHAPSGVAQDLQRREPSVEALGVERAHNNDRPGGRPPSGLCSDEGREPGERSNV
jgi:hypothetical protein